MNLVGHIIQKDLRRIWPHVLLWMAVAVVLYTWGRVATVSIQGIRGFAGFDLCFFGYGLLWFSLFPAIFSTDPAVGTTEFWMTRPIAGKTLFAAKLIEAVFIGIVLALLLHGGFLLSQGFGPSQVGSALIHFLPRLVFIAAVGVFTASQTRGIVQFWLLFLGLAGVLFLITHLPWRGSGFFTSPGRSVALGLVICVGSIAVGALQYRFRSRRISVLTATAFALSVVAILSFWKETTRPLISAPLTPLAWGVRREPWPTPGYSVEKMGFFDLRLTPRAGEIVRVSRAAGRLVWSDAAFDYQNRITTNEMLGVDAAVRAALGAEYTLIRDPLVSEDRLSFPLYARSGEDLHVLKFEGQIEGERVSMRPIGVLSLAKGSSVAQDGHKFEILEASSTSRRYIDVKGLYQRPHYRKARSGLPLRPLVVLVNETKKKAQILDRMNRYSGSFDSRMPGLDVMSLWWSVDEEWNGKGPSSSKDSSWIAEAKLYVFEFTLQEPVAIPVECSLIDPAPSTAVPLTAPAHVGL